MTFFYDLNKKLDSIREKPETTHKQLNERDMSRAAKGYEKYGKEGMEALAKAGREGKSLDPIRAKYDKYNNKKDVDESTGDYSAKKARAGKDIGKPGKNFEKIAKSAGERYGSKAAGERVAGAVLAKLRGKKLGEAGLPMDMGDDDEQPWHGIDDPELLQDLIADAKVMDYDEFYDEYSSLLDDPGEFWENYHEGLDEGLGDVAKKVGGMAKKVGSAVLNRLGHPDDEAMLKDLQRKMGVPKDQRHGKPSMAKYNEEYSAMESEGGTPMTAKQKSFAKLAPPKDKITFADKIAGAKKEVDEMLGDVAAEAIKGALTPKQKKLDKNNNGKLDANDFAMLRKGAKGKQETDEGWDDMMKDVERRRTARKVGDITHGAKHDTEEIPGGRRVTRRTDPNTGYSVGADDEEDNKNTSGEKRGRGRPKGSKKAMGAKGPSGRSKLMTKEADHDSDELKSAMALLKKAGYKVTKAKGEEELDEKAVSRAQQRFMGMVHATQKGEKAPSKEVAKVAKSMKKSDAEDFAATKHKGLPEKKKPEGKKKEKTEEAGGTGTPTASSGFSYGKGIYDSMNRELESMIAESMNISMNMNSDANVGPSKSLTVTATDDDAVKLSTLLKNAGLGGDHTPNVEGGADLDHPGAIEVHGTMDAEGAEDLADKIRQAMGDHEQGEEPCPDCGHADCDCDHEEVDEAYGDEAVDQNHPDYPTNTETSANALQYSGGLNKPKSSGMATIPVTDVVADGEDNFSKPARVNEDDLARLREMAGIKEAKKPDFTDVDNDGDEKESWEKAEKDKKVDEGILASTANLWKEYKGNYGV